MLEVKWKVIKLEGTIYEYICFNPCYVGSKMESLALEVAGGIEISFNPCYVGSKMESMFWLFSVRGYC